VNFADIPEVAGAVGRDLGRSRSIVLDQATIDSFAAITHDDQWIHVDPLRAAAGPYGTTIAHGYLTLSLISPFLADLFVVDGVSGRINYGLDRVRFPTAVPAGAALSATGSIVEVRRASASARIVLDVVIELDDDRVACAARVVVLLLDETA
jgi:acyl dehydratase